MKAKLKDEMNNLLSGNESEQKQFILYVSSKKPGEYIFRGRNHNEEELKGLQKGYFKTVIFKTKE